MECRHLHHKEQQRGSQELFLLDSSQRTSLPVRVQSLTPALLLWSCCLFLALGGVLRAKKMALINAVQSVNDVTRAVSVSFTVFPGYSIQVMIQSRFSCVGLCSSILLIEWTSRTLKINSK